MTPAESRARTLELAKELESHRPTLTHPTLKDSKTGAPLVIMAMGNQGEWVIQPDIAQVGIPDDLWDLMVKFVVGVRGPVESNGHKPAGKKRG